jgi:hypothetical protein
MDKTNEHKESDPRPSIRNGIFSFLNSSLGIWVLSTIFIGLITFTYHTWSESVKESRDKESEIKNLEIEINRRIFIFNKELDELATMDTSKSNYPEKIEEAIRKIDSKNCYVFEQFRKRKLSSLLYELYVLLPEKNKKVAYEAFEKAFLIEQFPSKINKKTTSEKANGYFDEIVSYTKTSLAVGNWDK